MFSSREMKYGGIYFKEKSAITVNDFLLGCYFGK